MYADEEKRVFHIYILVMSYLDYMMGSGIFMKVIWGAVTVKSLFTAFVCALLSLSRETIVAAELLVT